MTKGGGISPQLYVPQEVWLQEGAKCVRIILRMSPAVGTLVDVGMYVDKAVARARAREKHRGRQRQGRTDGRTDGGTEGGERGRERERSRYVAGMPRCLRRLKHARRSLKGSTHSRRVQKHAHSLPASLPAQPLVRRLACSPAHPRTLSRTINKSPGSHLAHTLQ